MVGTSSGPEVFAQLRQAATAARREADAAEQAAAHERDRATALDRDRLRTLRELAATQLPQLDGATAAAAMPELVDELQAFERQRQERAAALAREIAQLEAAMAERSSGLAAATRELDAAVARRDTLLQQVAAELARDPAYEPLSAQATQAEVRLARDVARADELRAEAKAKLGPYESSRLFQYLWRRRFGTAEYRSRGFAARMDRRVAELIGFARAADSYRFLTTTPRLVALEVERRTEEVRGLRARLEAMEDAVEQRLGVPPVQAEVDRMVAERERAVAAIDALQKRIAAAHTAVRDEAGGRGTFHAQALQRLTTFLARAEAGALERHARSTPDPRDDQLVAALRAITQQLADVQRRAGPLDDEARQRDAVADGLEDLLVRFRREDFDAGRSEFDGLDLTGLLVDVRRGSRPVSALWDALRSRQRFRRPPAVHHANRSHGVLDGVGLALQIGSVLAGAGRGARQRGGFSTGGGFGGGRCGGFSTGGGFGGGKGGFTTGESF